MCENYLQNVFYVFLIFTLTYWWVGAKLCCLFFKVRIYASSPLFRDYTTKNLSRGADPSKKKSIINIPSLITYLGVWSWMDLGKISVDLYVKISRVRCTCSQSPPHLVPGIICFDLFTFFFYRISYKCKHIICRYWVWRQSLNKMQLKFNAIFFSISKFVGFFPRVLKFGKTVLTEYVSSPYWICKSMPSWNIWKMNV